MVFWCGTTLNHIRQTCAEAWHHWSCCRLFRYSEYCRIPGEQIPYSKITQKVASVARIVKKMVPWDCRFEKIDWIRSICQLLEIGLNTMCQKSREAVPLRNEVLRIPRTSVCGKGILKQAPVPTSSNDCFFLECGCSPLWAVTWSLAMRSAYGSNRALLTIKANPAT